MTELLQTTSTSRPRCLRTVPQSKALQSSQGLSSAPSSRRNSPTNRAQGNLGPISLSSQLVLPTDFERGFIKAEIVSFKDLDSAGTMNEAKSQGKVRMEGKEYVMQDGDVVEFRFNV